MPQQASVRNNPTVTDHGGMHQRVCARSSGNISEPQQRVRCEIFPRNEPVEPRRDLGQPHGVPQGDLQKGTQAQRANLVTNDELGMLAGDATTVRSMKRPFHEGGYIVAGRCQIPRALIR